MSIRIAKTQTVSESFRLRLLKDPQKKQKARIFVVAGWVLGFGFFNKRRPLLWELI